LFAAGKYSAALHRKCPWGAAKHLLFWWFQLFFGIKPNIYCRSAARGIDVTGISHAINYDMPDTVDAYIPTVLAAPAAQTVSPRLYLRLHTHFRQKLRMCSCLVLRVKTRKPIGTITILHTKGEQQNGN